MAAVEVVALLLLVQLVKTLVPAQAVLDHHHQSQGHL
jgi:hypothetical protein